MNTKSTIQLVMEGLKAKTSFFEHLQQLDAKYDIKGNVFACSAEGNAEEISEGYFGEVKTYDSLDEAAKDFNIYMQGLYIHEGKYTVGNLYRKLDDVKEETIIDLHKSQIVS